MIFCASAFRRFQRRQASGELLASCHNFLLAPYQSIIMAPTDDSDDATDELDYTELGQKWNAASGSAYSSVSEADVPLRIAEFSKSAKERIAENKRSMKAKGEGNGSRHVIAFTEMVVKSCDFTAFLALEHIRYRWVVEGKSVVHSAKSPKRGGTPVRQVIDQTTVMPAGVDDPNLLPLHYRMVLQINLVQEEDNLWASKESDWIDWIYLRNKHPNVQDVDDSDDQEESLDKQSQESEFGISAFAARRFNRGTELGILVGEQVWEAPVVGSKAIPPADLPPDHYCKFDARTMKQTVIRSTRSLSDDFCMGMQFIRRGAESVSGSRKRKRSLLVSDPRGIANVEITDVGIVRVTKTVQKDGELFKFI